MVQGRRQDIAEVKVGDILARCPDCSGTLFRRENPGDDGGTNPRTVYRCTTCQKKVTRLELVNQIGDEAVRRARAALTTLTKKRPPGSKGGR